MAHIRAEALLGGAEDLLAQPRCVVDHRRLGEPGEQLGDDDGVIGRLLDVEEMPLAHIDVDPSVRERLCHLLGDRRTVFVHYLE